MSKYWGALPPEPLCKGLGNACPTAEPSTDARLKQWASVRISPLSSPSWLSQCGEFVYHTRWAFEGQREFGGRRVADLISCIHKSGWVQSRPSQLGRLPNGVEVAILGQVPWKRHSLFSAAFQRLSVKKRTRTLQGGRRGRKRRERPTPSLPPVLRVHLTRP